MTVEQIHMSIVNGQRRQAVNQIQEYGEYDFFADYKEYLSNIFADGSTRYVFFADATISYMRITNR